MNDQKHDIEKLIRNSLHTITIVFLLFASYSGFAQEEKISVHAQNKSLDLVLEELASNYELRFAFDADHFSQVKVNFNLENISVADFLDELCNNYHLLFEKIDETYVLYKNPAPLPEKKPEYVKLEGLVVDKNTGEPLMFCAIGIGENKGTITNESGIFSETVEKTDQIRVAISHLGYHRLDTTIHLTANNFHKIPLIPFPIHLEMPSLFHRPLFHGAHLMLPLGSALPAL